MAKLKFAVCGTFVKSLGHRRRIADAVAKLVYGAMAARLTPDQKVGGSNLSGLISFVPKSEAGREDAEI